MILEINKTNAFVSSQGGRFIFYLVPKALSRSAFSIELYVATEKWKADPVFDSLFTKEYENIDEMQSDLMNLTLDLDSGRADWSREYLKSQDITSRDILEVERKTTAEAIKVLGNLANSRDWEHLLSLGQQILKCDYLVGKKLDDIQKANKSAVLSSLASAYIETNKFDLARKFLDEAIKLNGTSEQYYKFGQVCHKLGNVNAANFSLKKALKLCDIEKKIEETAIRSGNFDVTPKNWVVLKTEIENLLHNLKS